MRELDQQILDVLLYDTENQEVKVSIDNRTKVLFMISLHCKSCIEYLPHIKEITDKYDLDYILLSTGDQNDNRDIKEYFNFSFPVVHLLESSMKKIFQITKLPSTLIIRENSKMLDAVVAYTRSDFEYFYNKSIEGAAL